MEKNNRDREHVQGMQWECEVLHFSRGDERAYIATDFRRTRIYTSKGAVSADSLKAAIARLEANGYRINIQMVVRVPGEPERPGNYVTRMTYQRGPIMKTEVLSIVDSDAEDEEEEE